MSNTGFPRAPYFQAPFIPQQKYTFSPPSGPLYRIGHISDTHLGRQTRQTLNTRRSEPRTWIDHHIPSARNFVAAIKTLHALNPAFVIHSGDIAVGDLIEQAHIDEIKSSLPTLTGETTVYCIRGNHDSGESLDILDELLSGWEVVDLDATGIIHEADGQIALFGSDYQSEAPDTNPAFAPPTTTTDAPLMIGVFHQSVRDIAPFAPAVAPDEFAPDGQALPEYYDLLLLGHMHTDFFDDQHCAAIDGGSTGGMTYNEKASVGLISLSSTAAHYRRYPVG